MSHENAQVEKLWNGIPRWRVGWIMLVLIPLVWCLSVLLPCPQANAAEATQETAAQARQLQMDGTLLQINGDIEGAIRKYEESLALQPNEKLSYLVNQLKKHSKVDQGSKDAPVTVESEARPTTSAESPTSGEREETAATTGSLPRQHPVAGEQKVGAQTDPMILDRALAERLMKETGLGVVIVRVGATNCISISDFLQKNNYGRKKEQYSWPDLQYFFDSKFLEFFIGFLPGDELKMINNGCFTTLEDHRDLKIIYGVISKVKCIGISDIENNKKKAEFELFVKKYSVGEKLGPESIVISCEYNLYDNGWRFEKILFEDINSEWEKKYLYGFSGIHRAANDMLLNMYKIKQYSSSYVDLLKILEKTSIPEFLSTVAFIYKDKGQKEKSIELYKNRIFPILRAKGGDLYKYEKLFDEIQK